MAIVYHVAHQDLREEILSEGLDPFGGRAIVLHAEAPDVPDGFDLWEIECDEGLSSGETVFCPTKVSPEWLELRLPSLSPGM